MDRRGKKYGRMTLDLAVDFCAMGRAIDPYVVAIKSKHHEAWMSARVEAQG